MSSLRINSDAVANLPPSAKLVYLVLQEVDPLTQAELRQRTQLPDRTVRSALERLEEAGVIESQPYLGDARQTLYGLVEE